MREVFLRADTDGSGALSLAEFQKCCKEADIGLTRKEVKYLMHQCDVDGDGNISYEEFIPLCFEMLCEILKDELLKESRSPTELEEFLLALFAEADEAQSGALDPITMREVLRSADLGLTRLQIHSLLAEGEYDADGLCGYKKFAAKASEMIYRMLDLDAQIERAEAVGALLADNDFTAVHGLGEAEVEAALMDAFLALDDGGTGLLPLGSVRQALEGCSLGLSVKEVHGMLSLCIAEPDGSVAYSVVASHGFALMQYLAQEEAMAA